MFLTLSISINEEASGGLMVLQLRFLFLRKSRRLLGRWMDRSIDRWIDIVTDRYIDLIIW